MSKDKEENGGTMEPEKKRWKGSWGETESWTAYPVLSDELSQDVELVEAVAAPIVDKKQTSRLVQELNSIYPLTGLPHIKRVRACKNKDSPHPLEVLICLVSDGKELKSFDSFLPSNKVGLGEPFIVKVPSRPPLTRPQFELVNKHWPTSFHEDKQVSVALRGELFHQNQKAQMHTYMTSAINAAKAGKRLGMEAVGAAIVDPSLEKTIAVSHDCRKDHPLHHAVMVCIDLVARSQGGGCYSYDKYPACEFTPGTLPPSENAAPQPYICTGYDLYVTREPCVLCAMALVHSRIGRVFYGTASEDGAFGSKYKMHSRKDLNHRFEVYRGVLGDQCEELNTDGKEHSETRL